MKYTKFIIPSIIITLIIVLTSCGKPDIKQNIISYKTVSSENITVFLSKLTPPNSLTPLIRLSDLEYMLPTEEWVNTTFKSSFRKFLFDYEVSSYTDGKNDCDDFALYGRAIANILNRHGNKGNSGIAVGEFKYLMGISGHAINFILVADKSGQIKILYFEPQAMNTFNFNKEDEMVPLSYTL